MRKVRTPNPEKICITNWTAKFTEIPIIHPNYHYKVSEILKFNLLPNVKNTLHYKTYIYWLICKKVLWELSEPFTETTKTTIKPIDTRLIWSKYPRWKIEGKELLKFLHINKML